MKSTQFSILTVLVIFSLFSLNAFAQNYTQFGLPEGVKARLGKGSVRGVAYSRCRVFSRRHSACGGG